MLNEKRIGLGKESSPVQARRIIDFLSDGIPDVLSLGRYEYHTVRPPLPAHSHPGAIEICYLERGCQTYRLENELFRLRGGDMLVVPPGVVHDTGNWPEDCGVLYWLILKLPVAGATLLHLGEEDSAAIAGRLANLPRQKFAGRPAMRLIFRRLFELYDAERSSLTALKLRHQLLCCLLELLHCAESGRGRAISADIRRTVQLIKARPKEEFALEQLARVAGLSLSRFKVKFKDETGISPREYILRVKVQRAKLLLLQDEDSITQVAVGLGFSSSQYFATVFKRFTQMTPVAFRRQERSPRREDALAAQARLATFETVL